MTAFLVSKAIVRTVFVLLNNLYAIPTYLIWMAILRPLLIKHPNLYHKFEGIAYSWLLHLVATWSWTSGYVLAEAGDDISDLVNSECLVISNHQSTADVPMLMYLCTHESKRQLARNIYWIMDVMFKYTNFGWVSSVHGDFYIRQGRDTRQSQLIELRSHLQQVYIPYNRKWILLFPEGGFFRKRKETSQAYARKHGYPVLDHVTLPRVGAMLTIMLSLSPSPATDADDQLVENSHGDADFIRLKTEKNLKWIIDITIAYPNGKPLDLLNIVFGNHEPCQTVMHFRRYRAEDVPHTEDALLKWVYDRWAEKDHLLAQFYETGKFPDLPMVEGVGDRRNGAEPRTLSLKTRWYLLINVLFFISTCLHLYVLYTVVSTVLDFFS